MTYINLKNFKLEIENPIDKDVLSLLLDNLQYRYDNPKLKDNYWHINENGFDIELNRKTNCNGKYVAITLWKAPEYFGPTTLFPVIVKVYEKEQKIRVIADDYMEHMDYPFKEAILKLLNHRMR